MVEFPARADLPAAVPGPGRHGWLESWWFDAVAADASVAVAVAVGRRGGSRRGWYWAVVAGEGRTTVVVADPDVALSASGPPLELRAPGLWADHNASAPGGHWSVACEAFGVALEDPWSAWGRAFGDPTPVGLDLEWDPVTSPVVLEGDLRGDAGSWSVGCEVHGEVLVGPERLELACRGTRGRWWGGRVRPAVGEGEVSGWSPGGWSHRSGDVVRSSGDPAGDLPGGVPPDLVAGSRPVAFSAVLDGGGGQATGGSGADGAGGRLAMAVVGGSADPSAVTGWVRWRP